jgi:hypothetical protein
MRERGAARIYTLSRLERARQLLGGIDALEHFESWRSPEQREPELMAEQGEE